MLLVSVEDEYTLGPHVEQEVGNAQVGDESVLLFEYLVIWRRMKIGILLPRCFRSDDMSKIGHSIGLMHIFIGRFQGNIETDEAVIRLLASMPDVETLNLSNGKTYTQDILDSYEEGSEERKRLEKWVK